MKDRIMIVEDDTAIMDTLGIFLQYEGYDVLKARTVERALELLEDSRPDLLLLDYMLQDDTAEPVVEYVRANYGDEIQVILLTAADDPDGKAARMGTHGVVAKPFELDALLRSVREVLTGKGRRTGLSGGTGGGLPKGPILASSGESGTRRSTLL